MNVLRLKAKEGIVLLTINLIKEVCMNSPLMKLLCAISWVITALAAINIGLMPFGYDFFTSSFVLNNLTRFIIPIHYAIGLAGAFSLAKFVWMLSCGGAGCGCGCSVCKCDSK